MEMIKLPSPNLKGRYSLEEALSLRRSARRYDEKHLSLQEISQILWAAQGVTFPLKAYRTSPSAGAIYPIELFLLTPDGFFKYIPESHSLEEISRKDLRPPLASAAFGQGFIAQAGITVIIAADYKKIKKHYARLGIRYADMEAGHIAQNIQLQAVALGLASVPTGAFEQNEVKNLLSIPNNLETIYLVPVGFAK